MRITLVGSADLPELLPLVCAYCDFDQVTPSDRELLALSRALLPDPQREGCSCWPATTRAWARKGLSTDITPLVAVSLARWGTGPGRTATIASQASTCNRAMTPESPSPASGVMAWIELSALRVRRSAARRCQGCDVVPG
jgi:hypothetical protein